MTYVSKIGIRVFAGAVVATGVGAGCASTPLHTEASTSGIRAAEEVGASKVPNAALHLQLAKEELEHAQGLAAEGDDEKASSMLLRAEADAELAVALSRQDAEKQKAGAAVERVRKLQQETM